MVYSGPLRHIIQQKIRGRDLLLADSKNRNLLWHWTNFLLAALVAIWPTFATAIEFVGNGELRFARDEKFYNNHPETVQKALSNPSVNEFYKTRLVNRIVEDRSMPSHLRNVLFSRETLEDATVREIIFKAVTTHSSQHIPTMISRPTAVVEYARFLERWEPNKAIIGANDLLARLSNSLLNPLSDPVKEELIEVVTRGAIESSDSQMREKFTEMEAVLTAEVEPVVEVLVVEEPKGAEAASAKVEAPAPQVLLTSVDEEILRFTLRSSDPVLVGKVLDRLSVAASLELDTIIELLDAGARFQQSSETRNRIKALSVEQMQKYQFLLPTQSAAKSHQDAPKLCSLVFRAFDL